MKRNQIILLILFGMLINGTTLLSQITYSGKGEVVAVRFLKLKGNIDVSEFEKFAVEEFNSKFDGAVPGLKQYISKSDRGIAVDSYAMLMIFDSQIVRDTMLPNRSPSEWFGKIMEDQQLWPIWNKLGSYVVDGSLGNYNDFVVLR